MTSRAAARPQGLVIRKLADRSGGQRFDPLTGAPAPWPLAGVVIDGDPPKLCNVPTSFVQRARAEGWLEVEGETVVARPAGPADDPWQGSHTFHHLTAIVLHLADGDVRYRVTHQPDKYADDGGDEHSDSAPVTDELYAAGATRVDWYYGLKLEG